MITVNRLIDFIKLISFSFIWKLLPLWLTISGNPPGTGGTFIPRLQRRDWYLAAFRCPCSASKDEFSEKLTGDMWLKVMHTARYADVPPSVCVSDGPGSTSGKDQRPPERPRGSSSVFGGPLLMRFNRWSVRGPRSCSHQPHISLCVQVQQDVSWKDVSRHVSWPCRRDEETSWYFYTAVTNWQSGGQMFLPLQPVCLKFGQIWRSLRAGRHRIRLRGYIKCMSVGLAAG